VVLVVGVVGASVAPAAGFPSARAQSCLPSDENRARNLDLGEVSVCKWCGGGMRMRMRRIAIFASSNVATCPHDQDQDHD
jgi:hypothetical protein